MGLALALLLVVVLIVAIGVHVGPHGAITAGLVGVAASLALLLSFAFSAARAPAVVAWSVLGLALLLSFVAVVGGLRSFAATRRRPAVQPTGLWGARGVTVTPLSPLGTVRVRGETWSAESMSGPLPPGVVVDVIEVDGLRLRVLPDVVALPESPAGTGDA